ncbi:hypothetical protein SM999_27075, partial [Escherichia coli]|nr:hypothetical protein [Escherichia coli]MEA0439767.1 hypothetical protein [Escherichia coli]
ETMIWQPEFTDKTLSRKIGAVHRTWYELKDSIPALVLSHAKYLEGSLISTSGGKLHDAMLSVR